MSISGWKSQQIIKQYDDDVHNIYWLFLPSDVLHCDYFSVFTGEYCKYQVNNKTDKYILNILEHDHLQNTMFTLLRIFIQEQDYISRI
jgi:hypothetical protein